MRPSEGKQGLVRQAKDLALPLNLLSYNGKILGRREKYRKQVHSSVRLL